MSKSIFLHTSGHLKGLLALIKFARDFRTRQALEKKKSPPNKGKVLGELFAQDGEPANGRTMENTLIGGKSRTVFTESHFRAFCKNFKSLLAEYREDINRASDELEKQGDTWDHGDKRGTLGERSAALGAIDKQFNTWTNNITALFKTLKEENGHQSGKITRLRKPSQVKMKKAPDPDLGEVEAILVAFHQKVGARHYKEAWKLLHPDFKDRAWGNEVERFIKGYVNSHAVKNIHVFGMVRESPEKIECKIYYEQELTVSHTSDLIFMQSATVADIERVGSIVNELRTKISKLGADGFENMQLYRLFEAMASEYIWYKYDVEPKEILKVLHIQKPVTVNRLFHCACIQVEGKWLISRIRRLEIASVR